MILRRSALVVLLALTAITGATASLDRPEARAPRPESRPGLQRLLDGVVHAGAPGVIAYTRDRRGTWVGASGFASLERKTRMRSSMHFRAGSITKTFTATIVLQLVGEGKLRLNDTIERWLPGLVRNGASISVRELLNHTSGIRDFNDPRGRLGPRKVIAAPLAQSLLFPPGTAWSYSNTNYILLGLVVEAATGSTFANELRRRIIAALKLTHTRFERGPTDISMPVPYARGYQRVTSNAPAVDVTSWKGHWASGGIVSTVADLARFYRALLTGRLLRPDLLEEMLTTVVAAPANGPERYGLGIERSTYSCGVGWGHVGVVPGFETEVLATRDASHVTVLAVNTGSDWAAAPFGLAIGAIFCSA